MDLDIVHYFTGVRGLRKPHNTRLCSRSSLAGAVKRIFKPTLESTETSKFSQILRVHLFTLRASWHPGQA